MVENSKFALLFDLHGNRRAWEVDSIGTEIELTDLALGLVRNRRVKSADVFLLVPAAALKIGQRLSNLAVSRLRPKSL